MRRCIIITLLAFCQASLNVEAEELYFERMGIHNGLSQNSVSSILQDKRAYMWFGTRSGLNRYDGRHLRLFQSEPGTSVGLTDNQIRCLAEDEQGRIWIGTNYGLCLYDDTTDEIRRISESAEGISLMKSILCIEDAPDGSIYISVEGQGVFVRKPSSDEVRLVFKNKIPLHTLSIDRRDGTIWFSYPRAGLRFTRDNFATIHDYTLSDGSRLYTDDVISSILLSVPGRIYIGLEKGGLRELKLGSAEATQIPLSEGPLFVRCILHYSPEELWIGSQSGIYIYNMRSCSTLHLSHSPYDRYTISDNSIHSLFKDKDGGIWAGTYFGGVSYLPHRAPLFQKYYYRDAEHSLKGKRIRTLCSDSSGALWIGTEDAGLFRLAAGSGNFEHFEESGSFSNIQDMTIDGDNLWVCTFSNGIRVINTKSLSIRKYETEAKKGGRLFSNDVFSVERSSDGRIYVGTMHGLQFYDAHNDSFGYEGRINGGMMVKDVKEDSRGRLWVGTLSYGLFRRDMGSKEWHQFSSENCSISSNNISCIFEDSSGGIWVGTSGSGLCYYNESKNSFSVFTLREGMPSNQIFSIIEDKFGYFWISTGNGLALFNPKTGKTERCYTAQDGLLCNQFNSNTGLLGADGRIYLGSIEGLVSFIPEKLHRLQSQRQTLKPLISEFSLLSDSITIPINHDFIRLKHFQNSFSIRLSTLSFSERTDMLYKLEGADDRWKRYDNSPIIYLNVPFGKHLFRMKASADTDNAREESVFLYIRPPLYLSIAAKVFYSILFISLSLLSAFFYHRRMAQKRRKYIRAYQRSTEKKMYDAKISFFTNITHEIRTPLSLIKAPLDSILEKEELDPEISDNLTIMSRNTDRILVLVNELLDFQKIEKNNIKLNLSAENLPQITESVFKHFLPAMHGMKKECSIDIASEDIYAMVDREAFTKICSNLFTNAMKYSDKSVRVILNSSDGCARLSISNDGEIVPADKRTAIFEPFFRHSKKQSGTGLGLSLCRSLAEMMHGSLVMSDDDYISKFVLTLPLCEKPVEIKQKNMEDYESEGTEEDTHCGDRILLVEDDEELRDFLKGKLESHWQLSCAGNGREALSILENRYISLIISDIMMPEMDGIELCRILKDDIRYTHIPLILLTAKTNLESKIESMNVGADAYVEKPFSLSYIRSVIANLLKKRQTLRESFMNNPFASVNMSEVAPKDSAFLQRLHEIIQENLSNSQFKMDEIAEMMNISRATLYRKINGVIDMTPNDYLRLERLKKAAQLLTQTDYNVSEVCYMTGFNSPSYFAKCFYKQFGEYPKNFRVSQ